MVEAATAEALAAATTAAWEDFAAVGLLVGAASEEAA